MWPFLQNTHVSLKRLMCAYPALVLAQCSSRKFYLCLLILGIGLITINIMNVQQNKIMSATSLVDSNEFSTHQEHFLSVEAATRNITSNHTTESILQANHAKGNGPFKENHLESLKDSIANGTTEPIGNALGIPSSLKNITGIVAPRISCSNNGSKSSCSGNFTSISMKGSVDGSRMEVKNDEISKRIKLDKSTFLETNELLKYYKSDNKADKHSFREVLVPSISCADRKVELVICVTGRRGNFKRRNVIRRTWGSYGRQDGLKTISTGYNNTASQGDTLFIFFIGSSSLLNPNQKAEQDRINKEAATSGDIYQLDFIDTYRNLTLKSLSILNFVSSRCPNASYVAKIDDDMYVNIPLWLSELREQTTKLNGRVVLSANDTVNDPSIPPFIYGYMFNKTLPHRNKSSKWYTSSKEYKFKFYPDYVSGTGYALSGSAALKLFTSCSQIPLFWMEDIFITGICRMIANVPLVSNTNLLTYAKRKPNGCAFRNSISGQGYSDNEILTIHKQLNSPSLKCN